MKMILFIVLMGSFISCGKSNVKAYNGPSNVLKNWEGRSEDPSFAGLNINSYANASNYLICTGAYPDVYNNQNNTFQNNINNNYYYDPYYNPSQYNNMNNNNPYYNNNNYPNNGYNNYYPTNYGYYSNSDQYYYNANTINTQNNYNKVIANKPSVTSAVKGNLILSAINENEGTITFGTLPYVGASNPNCQLLSDQTLDYKVSGNRLLVCFKAPNQNICFNYEQN